MQGKKAPAVKGSTKAMPVLNSDGTQADDDNPFAFLADDGV